MVRERRDNSISVNPDPSGWEVDDVEVVGVLASPRGAKISMSRSACAAPTGSEAIKKSYKRPISDCGVNKCAQLFPCCIVDILSQVVQYSSANCVWELRKRRLRVEVCRYLCVGSSAKDIKRLS
jgi:hypothetical protein